MQQHHILMQALEKGVARGEPEVHPLVYQYCMLWPSLSYPLILLTHLAKSHALYALILHSPMDHCMLSLTFTINSCYNRFATFLVLN